PAAVSYAPVDTFQSTPPRGGRRFAHGLDVGLWHVSIHAPARGATSPSARKGLRRCRFNPRPRAGGDDRCESIGTDPCCFNPRPRAGGDLASALLAIAQMRFQSTPPRGGRPSTYASATDVRTVSIHAPARGATSPVHPSSPSAGRFQSTPPRGGRRDV